MIATVAIGKGFDRGGSAQSWLGVMPSGSLKRGEKNFFPEATPSEVRKKAAWAWYRTFEMYERAAADLALGGTKQTNLAIISLGHG